MQPPRSCPVATVRPDHNYGVGRTGPRFLKEYHVPASAFRRLLADRPKVAGLAVPGMPIGARHGDRGAAPATHDVIAFGPSGQSAYARYDGFRAL